MGTPFYDPATRWWNFWAMLLVMECVEGVNMRALLLVALGCAANGLDGAAQGTQPCMIAGEDAPRFDCAERYGADAVCAYA